MATKPQPLHGVICPTITPVDESEHVDTVGLIKHLDRLIDHVDGIMALGTTGEFALLSTKDADRLVEVTVQHVAGRIPVIVGVGDTGTERVLRNVGRAERANADFVSACCPYYYPTADNMLIAHFRRIADESSLPLVLYNIPQNTVNNISLDVTAQLAKHPNIVGIKDSSGDMLHFTRLLELRSTQFAVLQGANERLATITWHLGADGYISGLENIAPGSMARIAHAVRTGDAHAISTEQQWIDRLSTITEQGFWLSAVKVAASLLSGGTGRPCQPLPQTSEVNRAAIVDILTEAGLL